MRVLNLTNQPALEILLEFTGFQVMPSADFGYDVVILEELQDLKELRSLHITTPVLVLSPKGDTDSKLKAFGWGADDYLTVPFHRDELVARLHAIIRRSQGLAESTVCHGPLTVDTHARTAHLHGDRLHLTNKEYRMLELLVMRPGVVITKGMFLDHLYGGMDEPDAKIIDVFLCKLRKRLGAAGSMIETVWGRGYLFNAV